MAEACRASAIFCADPRFYLAGFTEGTYGRAVDPYRSTMIHVKHPPSRVRVAAPGEMLDFRRREVHKSRRSASPRRNGKSCSTENDGRRSRQPPLQSRAVDQMRKGRRSTLNCCMFLSLNRSRFQDTCGSPQRRKMKPSSPPTRCARDARWPDAIYGYDICPFERRFAGRRCCYPHQRAGHGPGNCATLRASAASPDRDLENDSDPKW